MAGNVAIAIVLAAFSFAYLTVHMDREHGGLKLLNIGLFYFTTFVGLLIGSEYLQSEYPGTSFAGIAASFSDNFLYIVVFIFAYLVIYFLYKLMQDM